MNAFLSHFIEFAATPAGVVMCLGLAGALGGMVYDCVLQRRIDRFNRGDE